MFKGFSIHQFVPKTLWVQLVSLLLLALILAQTVALLIFVDTRRMLNNDNSEKQIISRIVRVVNSIDKTAPMTRSLRESVRKLSNAELRFNLAPFPLRGPDQRPEYSSRLKLLLLEKLELKPRSININSEGPRGAAIIRRDLPHNIQISIRLRSRVWVHVTRISTKSSLRWLTPLLFTMLIMVIFIIIIVSLIVRRLTKPLGELVDAADKLGRGQEVAPLQEFGAEDVRKVTRSFNQMNQKVKNFVDDRTKMLAAISHDLRTPITSMRLRAEFIEDKETQAKILESLTEMQTMTEAALKFSTDSSSSEKTKKIDLKSMLEILVSDYNDMGKSVTLVDFGNAPQIILSMRVQSIKRALRNLIDNGINYGEKVEISFKQNKSKSEVEIFIKDSGMGIDKAEFEQVFEPFYRLEKSRNKDTGGVGLGLSIARNIVRAHGGDVTLSNITKDSKICGLELKICLPLDKEN